MPVHLFRRQVYRHLLAQWGMHFSQSTALPRVDDLKECAMLWLDGVASETQAVGVDLSTATNVLVNYLRQVPELEYVATEIGSSLQVSALPVLTCMPWLAATWETLFQSREDYESFQFLTDSIPPHFSAAIIRASLQSKWPARTYTCPYACGSYVSYVCG